MPADHWMPIVPAGLKFSSLPYGQLDDRYRYREFREDDVITPNCGTLRLPAKPRSARVERSWQTLQRTSGGIIYQKYQVPKGQADYPGTEKAPSKRTGEISSQGRGVSELQGRAYVFRASDWEKYDSM